RIRQLSSLTPALGRATKRLSPGVARSPSRKKGVDAQPRHAHFSATAVHGKGRTIATSPHESRGVFGVRRGSPLFFLFFQRKNPKRRSSPHSKAAIIVTVRKSLFFNGAGGE